jgi:hypothetical protein
MDNKDTHRRLRRKRPTYSTAPTTFCSNVQAMKILTTAFLATSYVSLSSAHDLRGRSRMKLSKNMITNLMGLPSTTTADTTTTIFKDQSTNPSQASLLEAESLVHILKRTLGGDSLPSSSSTSKKDKKTAIDPIGISIGQTVQASMAYGQPVAHPVNTAWNPLNQGHTPQAASNQVFQLPYDPISDNQNQNLDDTLGGYSAFPQGTAVLAELRNSKTTLLTKKEISSNNPENVASAPSMVVETTPTQTSQEYASQTLASRGQPVANPTVLAGTSVVQHPALANIMEGLQANPFGKYEPDASSFATNPLAYHPLAKVSNSFPFLECGFIYL